MRQLVIQTLKRVPRSDSTEDTGAIELVWEIAAPGRAEQETGNRKQEAGNWKS